RRVVFERAAVDRPDFFFGALAHALVKTLAGLLAEPAALHHRFENGRDDVEIARGIVRGRLAEIAQHMYPNVDADDVQQAEAGALGQSDDRAGERIHLLNGEIELLGELVYLGAEKTTDAVADEVRGVLAMDHAFAQVQIAEGGDPIEDFRQRVR